jgi:hypothetical protein
MSSNTPSVKPGQWIRIGSSIDGYVFSVDIDGELEVGYYQNRLKAIKETVVWDGTQWEFKHKGPNGSYLRGTEEAIVKRGPHGLFD